MVTPVKPVVYGPVTAALAEVAKASGVAIAAMAARPRKVLRMVCLFRPALVRESVTRRRTGDRLSLDD